MPKNQAQQELLRLVLQQDSMTEVGHCIAEHKTRASMTNCFETIGTNWRQDQLIHYASAI